MKANRAMTLLLVAASGSSCGVTPSDEPAPPGDSEDVCVEPTEPADHETEYLRITNRTGTTICAGTFDMLDAEVERLAALMKLPVTSPLEVQYGIDAVNEACGFDPESVEGGCVHGHGCETITRTTYMTQVHELVHAIRQSNGISGPPCWRRGSRWSSATNGRRGD